MRTKDIEYGQFKITLRDNARQSQWGWSKVVKIVQDSVCVLEDFLYSRNTELARKKHSHIELDVLFCGDTRIRTINRDFRNKDKTTDVLSFPSFESMRKGSEDMIFPGLVHIGDIIISRDVAKRQAKEFNLTVEQEIIHLLVHGFLHLLGWDHEISQKEEEIMQAHEKAILDKIRKIRK